MWGVALSQWEWLPAFCTLRYCKSLLHCLSWVHGQGRALKVPSALVPWFNSDWEDPSEYLSGIGLPWWPGGKESTCQCRRCAFDPWSGKIPWRREWQPTPVFLPGEPWSLVGYSPWSHKVWNDLATEQQRFANGDRPSGTPSPLGEASCLSAPWSCFTCLPGCAQLMSIPCSRDYSNHLGRGAEAEKSGVGEKLRVMSASCFLYFRANRAWPFGMQLSSLRKKLRLRTVKAFCPGASILCFVSCF